MAHLKSILIKLFLLFIVSTTSMVVFADAATDYYGPTLHCVNCHGSPAGTGLFKFTAAQLKAKYPEKFYLKEFIRERMPKDAMGTCDDACANDMVSYLLGNEPPVANMNVPISSSGMAYTGVAPLTITLEGKGSTDDKGIVSYKWSFGDGTANSSSQNISHTYNTVGTYTLSLTVTDAEGLTSTTSKKITVVSTKKKPTINTSKTTPLTGTSPLTVKFDGSLTTCDGGCVSYGWSMPDGSGLQGAIGTYTFTEPGTYPVVFTVYDAGLGSLASNTATVTITVSASSAAPVANASKTFNSVGAAPLTVKFDGSLSSCANTCKTYTWNFGDGTSSTGSSPTVEHTYNTVKNSTVTLTVTDKSNNKTGSTTITVKAGASESLSAYVNACKTSLGFQTLPDINCYDGDRFADSQDFGQNSRVNDFLLYKKVTDQVDMTVACRWLTGSKTNPTPPVSIEMFIHNRQSGKTCFFSAKGFVSGNPDLTSASIVSPTNANAATVWDAPADVDGHIRCIGCHVSGAYIATPTIAPFLAKYGLLNNGHDTLSNVKPADLTTLNKNVKYSALSAGAFSQWDSLKQSYIDPSVSCSIGCHYVGTLSPQDDIGKPGRILDDIVRNPASQLSEINHANVMAPFDELSDYRWINLDIPADGYETENLADARAASNTLVPILVSNCAAPTVMEAHVVGSDNHFIVNNPSRFALLPDKLSTFNVKDGLVCLNKEQESGLCEDYKVRYECTKNNTVDKTWTNWINNTPRWDGDYENRPGNVCASGSTATGIQASVTLRSNGKTYLAYGPNDRLDRLSPYGLACSTSSQPDGQCANYVVRYTSCINAPEKSNKHLVSVFTGRQLTATGGSNNAPVKGQPLNMSWNTQEWSIEPIADTEFVRLKNNGTGTYLNVTTLDESALVVTYSLVGNWDSQKWIVEPVSGNEVRLRNVWTGRYLTIGDVTASDPNRDYAPVFSQALNTAWSSQRWILQ